MTADQQGNPAGELREVQSCLTGRVRSADDVHLLPYQCRRFHAGRAIEHSGADEAPQTSDAEAAVGHTGGKDYCLSGGLASVVEREDVER
jgi:hypothetical protein